VTLDASAIVADAGFTGKSYVSTQGTVVLNDGSKCVGISQSGSMSPSLSISGTATITQKYPNQTFGVSISQGSLNFQTTGATLKFNAGTFYSSIYAATNITATTATATIDASADTDDTMVFAGTVGGPAETSFMTLNLNARAYNLANCLFTCQVDPTSSKCDQIVCAGNGTVTLGGASSSITIDCPSKPTATQTWTFLSGAVAGGPAGAWTKAPLPTIGVPPGTWAWDVAPPNGPKRSISYTLPKNNMIALDAYFAWVTSKKGTSEP
jgi:hypothetical protein